MAWLEGRRHVEVVLKVALKVCTDVASWFAPPARQKPTPLLTLAPPPESEGGGRGSWRAAVGERLLFFTACPGRTASCCLVESPHPARPALSEW